MEGISGGGSVLFSSLPVTSVAGSTGRLNSSSSVGLFTVLGSTSVLCLRLNPLCSQVQGQPGPGQSEWSTTRLPSSPPETHVLCSCRAGIQAQIRQGPRVPRLCPVSLRMGRPGG